MRLPPNDRRSLWKALTAGGHRLPSCYLSDPASTVSLDSLTRGSSLGGHAERLRDHSVLLATRDQLASALALIELDGLARRLVLVPAGMPSEYLPSIIGAANIDVIVTDEASPVSHTGVESIICGSAPAPADGDRDAGIVTEWVLLTSGTTGQPKLTLHTLATLTGAITARVENAAAPVWSTFYDIRRYGGLQIFLRALLGGGSMILSSPDESTADFFARAAAARVTHISGTPSHWRRALMSPMAHHLNPQYVRLSGEVADQAILDNLRKAYPRAMVAHAFASTEAGVAFDVRDGRAGFPAEFIGQAGDVELKVEEGSLHIRSPRVALRYLGDDHLAASEDGFVDTGDLVELRDGRYYFAGRRDGMINVGGAKVHPEEVEAVLNRHPQVRMALVKARKNRFTGTVVVADVVLNSTPADDRAATDAALQRELIAACHDALADYKVPAAIRFVPSLDTTASGKLARLSG